MSSRSACAERGGNANVRLLAALCAVPLLAGACGAEVKAPATAGAGTEVIEVTETEETELTEETEVTEEPVEPTAGTVLVYQPVVVAEYPHDTSSFTQGLEFANGLLLESTGRYGSSTMRLVEPETGAPTAAVDLDDEFFGEGASLIDDEIFQLTWKSGTLIVRDAVDLSVRGLVSYEGEGWGLCDAEDRLIMSNGSSTLSFRDRESFDEIGSVVVTEDGQEVERINELECVAETVWANIYQSNRIISIDMTSGRVTGTADLSSLVPTGFEDDQSLVLNGIAHQQETGRFWVTGKEWPVLYEIELRLQG